MLSAETYQDLGNLDFMNTVPSGEPQIGEPQKHNDGLA